jgi:DNA-binding NtrC family response regulator
MHAPQARTTARTLLCGFYRAKDEDAMPNLSPSRTDHLASPDRATVVLVDREALYHWFVTESLQGRDIDVVPCRSLDEATAVLDSQGAADLLLVDSDLILGRDAETLRALSQDASMRCVVLDSDGSRRRPRGYAVTFADKPVDRDAVVRLVTAHLGAHRPAA